MDSKNINPNKIKSSQPKDFILKNMNNLQKYRQQRQAVKRSFPLVLQPRKQSTLYKSPKGANENVDKDPSPHRY